MKDKTIIFILLIVTFFASTATFSSSCEFYASSAVEQNEENLLAGCGYTGSRWNNDKEGQKRWCLSLPEGNLNYDKETKARENLLIQCYKKKTSPHNPDNQLKLPKQCKDPAGTFIPVKYIYSRSTYNSDASLFNPVNSKNGYIHYDFNQDGIKDYIFIERGDNTPILLAKCISDSKNSLWQRGSLSTMLGEEKTPSYSIRYNGVSIDKKGYLSISDDHHEHNWGSDTTIYIHKYDLTTKKFKVVKILTSSSSGDGFRSDRESETNYITGWKTETVICGFQEDKKYCKEGTTKTRIKKSP